MMWGNLQGSVVRWLIGAVSLGLVAVTGAGCADLEAARAFRADAAGLRDSLNAQAARWEATLDALPAGDPARPAVEAERAQAQAAAALVEAGLARVDEVLAEATQPTDPLTQTVGAASPLLPMSLRGPLLLGAAAVVAGLRAWRLKAGLSSVARGLSAALREDEEFRACFTRHADTFRSTQTPTAKRVVDELTSTRPMLALPI
jgi:phytoene dehydrogenase-like protein